MNLRLVFNHPWLLLLLIPALALVVIPHLRLSKKYRRTRNRIISLVLMSLIMGLSISVLAGATFNYTETNYENELVILVDVSDSNDDESQMAKKNTFLQNVLRESGGEYRTAIIKFANGYVEAASMGYDTEQLYADYLRSANPDKSGTNIAGALTHAKSIITKPKAAKVVILTDGVETDGEAMAAVMALVLDGTRVDTVHFPSDNVDREYQINAVKFPDYNFVLGEEFTITLTIQSTHVTNTVLTVSDNGEESEKLPITLQKGTSDYQIKHKFANSGAHEIRFTLEGSIDRIAQNNMYTSYYYLEVVDRLLIIQREDEAQMLSDMLEQNFTLSETGKIDVTNFGEEDCPKTVEELTAYDQIILMNIANADMPLGFVDLLSVFVGEFGGGLLTIGGSKTITDETGNPKVVANTYDDDDMYATDYAKLLPIETVDSYTPPLALMLVIDTSSSMREDATVGGVKSRMDLAKEGAIKSLDSLSPRDYVGVVSFNTLAKTECDLVPYSDRQRVADRINRLSPVGATYYSEALAEVSGKLASFSRAKRKHIMFITDGKPTDDTARYNPNGYLSLIKNNIENGITMSVIDIGDAAGALLSEIESVIDPETYYGRDYDRDTHGVSTGKVYPGADSAFLHEIIRADLEMPLITNFVMEPFTPVIGTYTRVTDGITTLPKLDGYFGVQAKAKAVVPIVGDYAPLYAQWDYGKGKVGSFMSDLNGYWSPDFFNIEVDINEGKLDENKEPLEPVMVKMGVRLILNIIRELFPIQSIKYNEIKAEITTNNYRPMIQVDNKDGLPSGEYYEVKVSRFDTYFGGGKAEQTIRMNAAGKLFKCEYSVYEPGIYFITIQRKNASGAVLDEYSTHTVFSYSAEYNAFVPDGVGEQFLTELAARGGGKIVDIAEPGSVLEAVTDISVSYDPRTPLIIAVIILFLLDVAVRKFKFKWPWEIVRLRREKKAMEAIKARRAGANSK